MSQAALPGAGNDDAPAERSARSSGFDLLNVLAGSPWARFAARRLGQLLISVLVLVTAAFLMIHLVPGNPVRAALGIDAGQDVVNARRAALGLNDPLWLQYAHYLRGLLTGRMGDSITSGLPVAQTISQRLPATLELAGYAFAVSLVVAIPLGLTMGVATRGGRRRGVELAFTAVAVLLGAIPGFLLAFGLIDVFSVQLGWTPVALQGGFSSYVLPVLSLAIGPAVILARILRLEVLAALQVLVATRLSVLLALAATAIGVGTGLLLGTAPLVLGRRAGRFITAVVNIAVAFPALLLALFSAVIFGVGARGALLAIGFASAPTFARLTRTLSASVAGLDYIAAARIAGVSRVRLLTRHALPNIGETLIVNATISAGDALLSFAGLSFLGLGLQAPSYDWGKLLNDGLNGIYVHPVAALAPGFAVVLAGLAFNLFGEAMARTLGVPELAGGAIMRAVRAGRGARRAAAAASPGSAQSAARPGGRAEPRSVIPDCVLSVRDLRVSFPGGVHPVRGLTFALGRGEAVGVVGESGSGKSLTALAVARLLEPPAVVSAGEVRLLGHDLLGGTPQELRKFLGTSAGMVFQDPMTSFNPVRHVGGQLAEVATQHQRMTRRQAATRAMDPGREGNAAVRGRVRAVRVPAERARRGG